MVTIKDDFMHFVCNGTLLFTATVNRQNADYLDDQVVPMTSSELNFLSAPSIERKLLGPRLILIL